MNGNKTVYILFFFFSLQVFAQQVKEEIEKKSLKSQKDSIEIYKPIPEDYFYSTNKQSDKIFDTSLSLKKYYKRNFLRKDHFGLMSFSNMGRPLNSLVYRPKSRWLPDIGFSAKRYSLITSDEVRYFDVKTPLTEIFYESGINQGYMLQALFTQSPHKRINYSFQYSSLRSLGYYPKELSASHIYLIAFNYRTPQERYKLWFHFFNQNINNQENGGIQDIQKFRYNQSEFKNRKNIKINLSDAESRFKVKCYYLRHYWSIFPLIKGKSSFYHSFVLKHEFCNEIKNYLYQEKKEENFFSSDAYLWKDHRDKSNYEYISNKLTLALKKEIWHLESGLQYDRLIYRFPLSEQDYLSKIETNVISIKTDLGYNHKNKWIFNLDGHYALNGKFKHDMIFNTKIKSSILEKIKFGFKTSFSAIHPDFNTMLYRSFYKKYNYGILDFKAVNSYSLHLYLLSKKYFNFYYNFYKIDRYTYFDQSGHPMQYNHRLNFFDIQTNSIIKFNKIVLENRLQYQHVSSGNEILLLPNFIARVSLYYENIFFEKSLFLQTGVTLNYFSRFRSKEFIPVINEFVLPSSKEPQFIGGYPFIDYFLNFKVFRMQFYIRAQHFNVSLGNHNYFSAPNYPAMDFILRLGILWNLFT